MAIDSEEEKWRWRTPRNTNLEIGTVDKYVPLLAGYRELRNWLLSLEARCEVTSIEMSKNNKFHEFHFLDISSTFPFSWLILQ